MSMTTIELYNSLREKFGDNQAHILTEYIETKIEATIEKETKELATKNDVGAIRTEMAQMEVRLIKWLVGIAFTGICVLSGVVFTIVKYYKP